jgi:hypothetical protein
MRKTPREWLLEIATALETWHTERRASVEAGMVITPSGVVEYILRTEIPAADREAVRDALPVWLAADFSEAAWRIRKAATLLPS